MRWFVCVFVLLLAAAAAAQTVTQADTSVSSTDRAAVSYLLGAIHEMPTKSQLEAASSRPWLTLTRIAQGRGPIAERAVDSVFLWPDDRTFHWAVAAVAQPDVSRARLNRLLLRLAVVFGARSTDVVVSFFGHHDAQVRITAAAAVARIRTDEAFAHLDRAIAAEAEAPVAEAMRRYAVRVR